eukprot:2161607-Pyramimonas_sp.AAC.1
MHAWCAGSGGGGKYLSRGGGDKSLIWGAQGGPSRSFGGLKGGQTVFCIQLSRADPGPEGEARFFLE